MKVTEAVSIIKAKYNRPIKSCVEYDRYFVFEMPVSTDKEYLDCSYKVDKLTKEIDAFIPLELSIEEYLQGKEIRGLK